MSTSAPPLADAPSASLVAGARSRIRRLGDDVSAMPARAFGLSVIAMTLLLEIVAWQKRYGLRVTADTPTYLSLLRQLALHPLRVPQSPFHNDDVNLSHATPDLQLLALIWRGLSGLGVVRADLIDLMPAFDLLVLKGLIVTLVVFHALHRWVRHETGSPRIAWLAVAALPAVWGPALIVSPGDLSLHGLMSTADHSEALAIAFALYALVALDQRLTLVGLGVSTALVSATMVTHPFTGVRLAAITTAVACLAAARRDSARAWKLTPPALVLAYVIAELWPAYSLSRGMLIGPLNGWQVIALFAIAPYACLAVSSSRYVRRAIEAAIGRLRATRLDTDEGALFLGRLSLVVVALVATRELWLFQHPDPWLHTNRLSIYWTGSNLVYWPLLLAPAYAGFAGLASLARRGRPLPLVWASGCLAIGSLGALGLAIPLWHRFVLFAQVPLALGVAVVIGERRWPSARVMAAAVLALSTAFAFGSLVLMPQNVTYFGNRLQGGWYLDRFIPRASEKLVASDPASEYYVLAIDGRVLTMTTWHIGGKSELVPARQGYTLMHRLYTGDRWRTAAQEMWRMGVRYVVANRGFRIQEPTLDRFSSRDVPYIVRSWDDQDEVLRYMQRLKLVGTRIGAIDEYHVYRLDHAKLFPKGARTRA